MEVYIGLDIGGTKFLAAAADTTGRILAREHHPTPAALDRGLALLQQCVRRLASNHRLMAIGAAIGGPLDWRTGIVSPLHQPAWRQVPLKQIMQEEFGCPFYVDVDTNVAALGEYRFGKAQATRFVYLTLSTGMGGALVLNGEIYRGHLEAHPEVGHQSIAYVCRHPERVACECGAPDCLEALVSGNGIQRIYGKAAESLESDEWEEVAFNLGLGLRNIACFYAPEVIVLGGGVAVGGGERLLRRASRVMQDRLRLVPVPRVQLSSLGYETALMGAIAIAIDGL